MKSDASQRVEGGPGFQKTAQAPSLTDTRKMKIECCGLIPAGNYVRHSCSLTLPASAGWGDEKGKSRNWKTLGLRQGQFNNEIKYYYNNYKCNEKENNREN